jgi:hypothetical protein
MVGLPIRPFLFTVDQIATLLSAHEQTVKDSLFYDGRSTGRQPKDKMIARNIAIPGARPEWRVSEQELIRWMRFKNFKVYERGWVRS